MKIERINTYQDKRFSEKVLQQHGAFLVGDKPYEVEIISATEAVVYGDKIHQKRIIEEFRFFAEHISKFYNEQGECIAEYDPIELFEVQLSSIQPSQFFVDHEKKTAVENFIQSPEDIIIPLIEKDGRYVSLDGHTRLYVAVARGYHVVKGFLTESDEWIHSFVGEAKKRGVCSPYDIKELSHEEYEIKWNKFCDDFFENKL